ncbi:MAG: DUF6588 family protein [Bacteroidota bacterium]|nr:DUF6588 family protein [Bacteroidota bacterium]
MKSINYLRITPLMLAFLLMIAPVSKAQFDDFDFFNAGIEDGMELFVPYVTPWVNAFGTDLNGGWFNSARPHKLGGFDITFTTSVTLIPEADRSMDINDMSFTNLTLVDPNGSTIAPTVAGSTTPGPDLVYEDAGSGVEIASFASPQGSGLHFFPAPMIQAGVGLPYGTEIIGRFFPKAKIPSTDARLGLWGIGVKHSVLQYFKTLDKLPLDVSVFGGYTNLSSSVGISVQPVDGGDNLTDYDLTDFQDQSVEVTTQGYNISLIASTTLPVINVYGSLGYSSSQTDILIDGPIPIPFYRPGIDPGAPVVTDDDVQEIPAMEIKNKSGFRTTIGARLKMAAITLHADYTYAKYSVFTGGIGVSIR